MPPPPSSAPKPENKADDQPKDNEEVYKSLFCLFLVDVCCKIFNFQFLIFYFILSLFYSILILFSIVLRTKKTTIKMKRKNNQKTKNKKNKVE